ncbi:MAG: GNAT family N-acetyltransferase [Gammaproteobacteria bacterium]|nr:GNAT family N-acetyltransferase [Gammaproteobacteria bacterium]
MLHNFSQIRELLAHKADFTKHRHVFIFAGDESWQNAVLKDVLLGHEEDTLWLGENVPESIPSISVKKAQSWLGREKRVVVFNANEKFDPDGFAAISGIIVGGGLFILLMPAKENWNKIYSTFFGQRLIKSIQSSVLFNVIKQDDKKISIVSNTCSSPKKQNCIAPFLTTDQQYVVENIEMEVGNKTQSPVVLTSDRGRGKSAALGIAAAKLIKAGIKKIVITAPRLRATDVVFKHIEQLLPGSEIKRGQIKLNDSVIQFYPPDQIQLENIEADLLLVDEAAAIPVSLLTSFLNKFPQCVFATTVHGYEGTGRGFSVRFNKVLSKQTPGWKKLQMKTPIRWAEDDPLEQWMFSLLCLDAEIAGKSTLGEIDNNKLDINIVHRKQLMNDELLLKETFSLLVLAHYRTQPGDLQRLLDDEELSLFIIKYKQHVIAIAWVGHEGKFPTGLSTAVYRGERRPPGHLLAQALTYHCGVENAATLNYSRIMRIAVHPEFQEQGIGSKLLEYIIDYEKKQGRDAIGTSFGLNTNLLNFWKHVGLNVVRIGFKREQTSGEHAAIMLKPLSQQGEIVYQHAYSRFLEQLPFWFDDVLSDLPKEIKQNFQLEPGDKQIFLTDEDNDDIKSFIHYTRNYELCIAALNKLVLLQQQTINQNTFPDELQKVLKEKVFNKKDWKQIATEMSLNGKEAARQLFKKAIIELVTKNKN